MSHVLITGASSGLGAALAQTYALSGAHLALFGRNAERLEATASQCRDAAASVSTHHYDVTGGPAMAQAIASLNQHRPLDIVIANAGIGGRAVLSGDGAEPRDVAQRVIDVNLMGVVNTIGPLIDPFVARGQGKFCIVSSIAAHQGVGEAPAYSAAKAGARLYGESLRRKLRPSGVGVTVITPGFIDTPMSRSLPYRPLFSVSPDRAAQLIFSAVERGKAEFVFPWQFKILVAIAPLLPIRLVDALIAAGEKQAARP